MVEKRRKSGKEKVFNKLKSAMYRAGFKNIRQVGNTIHGEAKRWNAPVKLIQYLDKHYTLKGGYGSHAGHPTYIRYKGRTEDITYKAINNRDYKLIVYYKG